MNRHLDLDIAVAAITDAYARRMLPHTEDPPTKVTSTCCWPDV